MSQLAWPSYLPSTESGSPARDSLVVHLFRRLRQSAARKLTASRMIAELSGLDVRENCERVQGEAPRCRFQLAASPGVS